MSNPGSIRSAAAAGPDARMSSWPASAGPLLPDTGASTNVTSGRTRPSRAASPAVALTPIVPICTHTAPGANGGGPPANITDSTTSASGSMVITTWASLIASDAEAAATAPAAASGAVAAADRSHTVVGSPAVTRLRAMAEPMMPVPSTAAPARSVGASGYVVIDFSHRIARIIDVLRLAPGEVTRPHTAG